ncbi:helix-turn-helix transcriptional regulator [Sporosarcina sp. JAI121]|uniref:helix-turn-helix transcriptional regulator n=1 Tax=Sporosarcina sp. JAI121 TaxID=2723064 RepID=UPI0015CCFE20|nr:helix-turn-helix transcriptional regulator [Sporosarcina sp. JAI121]NYF23767.1 tetratricopeptide (TPR) repeat protein [Sporosarcina sp. JAI121]
MKVGHLIRAERIRQQMKQLVLAKGICTPSYLSKIERNLIFPSEDIVTLLFNRLGIDPSKLQKNDQQTEIDFEKMLETSYKEVITNRDANFTKQKLEYLETHNPLFENQTLYYTYLLIMLRFRIMVGRNLDERKKEIDDLEELSKDFTPRQTYLYKLNTAIYYYSTENRNKSIEYFEDVLLLVDDISLEAWEKAELNYMIGVVYTADSRIFTTIDYIRSALDYFRENFLMKRVLDCYVLIGITRKKSEQFQEALESYLKAMQICDEFNMDLEKGIIYHNIGSLYGTMGNSEDAIKYYKKSIEYKSEEDIPLISVLCLVVEYSKVNNKKLVIDWCNEGLSMFSQLKDKNLTSYFHHFNIFKSLHSDQGLSVEITEDAIDYFKSIEDFQYIHKYSIALAEWYYKNRKYKLSAIYYQEANKYGYLYRKINRWEDL